MLWNYEQLVSDSSLKADNIPNRQNSSFPLFTERELDWTDSPLRWTHKGLFWLYGTYADKSLFNAYSLSSRFWESRDGAVVRRACLPPMWSGFHSRTRRHVWFDFVVGSRLAQRGFSPGPPVFFPQQIPTFPNSNSTWRVDPRENQL